MQVATSCPGDCTDPQLKSRVALLRALDEPLSPLAPRATLKNGEPDVKRQKLNGSPGDTVVGSTLGTLTIGKSTSRYVGKLAGSEYLHETPEADSDSALASPEKRPASLPGVATLIRGKELDLKRVREKLPSWEKEGRALVELYWSNVDWM